MTTTWKCSMFACVWLAVFEWKCHLWFPLRAASDTQTLSSAFPFRGGGPFQQPGTPLHDIPMSQLRKQKSGPWMTSDLTVSKHTSEQVETGCSRIPGGGDTRHQSYLKWGTFATALWFTQFSCQNEQAVSMATKNTKTVGRLMTPDNGNVLLKVY